MTALPIEDPSLVVLIGPAGAGKSTLARRMFAGDEVLSSDALRAAIGRDEADQSVSGAAFAVLHRELTRRLAAGRLTVVDATNLLAGDRRPLLARAAAAGVPAVAIVLDLPSDVVAGRNGGRDRVVDGEVVARHLERLRAVVGLGPDGLRAEGFASVTVLRTVAEVDALAVVRLPPSAGVTPHD